MKALVTSLSLLFLCTAAHATEYHVSPAGNDTNAGTQAEPLRTVQRAADLAQPGDVVTLHAGVYRERVNPPRGGTSDSCRITYQAAANERAVIKGSEVVKGWVKLQNDTWKATVPNRLFGKFNPFADLISGDWFNPKDRKHHTAAVYLNGHWLTEAATLDSVLNPVESTPLWFGQVDDEQTTIWAQFPQANPNDAEVEINVRQTVFYPEKTGINYLTVRGLTLLHAATPWAPPTAEQIGLIGTNWSKGWIIENNDVRYSVCTGITLGKHGDQYDNTSENSAEGYVETIKRALAAGWSKQNIGHHVVRNNHIAHCEQAGIVGSMGAAFCTVTGNVIREIHVRQLFTGAEMAGIKFHGAVDTLIQGNHIYRTTRGIWLDWMAQGTRVTRNLLHDNGPREDLFLEVNHGPCVIDNNLFLSDISLLVNSQGAAFAHNLFAGRILVRVGERRLTPALEAHGTQMTGLYKNPSGDDRYYSNIFVNGGLSKYDPAVLPVSMAGNVFLKGATPSKHATNPLVRPNVDPGLKLTENDEGVFLTLSLDAADRPRCGIVTSKLLGKSYATQLPYEQPDGTPYRLNTDYFGQPRNEQSPTVGPFANLGTGPVTLKVW